jgi:hypothetical protein
MNVANNCMSCTGRPYRSMNRYNQGRGGMCGPGEVMRICPGNNARMCVQEGTMWDCVGPTPIVCPKGQSLYFCPDGSKVCADVGSDLRLKCAQSPY